MHPVQDSRSRRLALAVVGSWNSSVPVGIFNHRLLYFTVHTRPVLGLLSTQFIHHRPASPLASHLTTMKNPWLLFLAPFLLAVSSSLPHTAAVPLRFPAAGRSPVQCIGDGVYAANSTYQANLRRVAALLLAEVSASPGQFYYTTHAVGYWPNRLLASSLCRRRDVNGTHVGYPCADCIAGAFLQMERACPYRREAFYIDRNCSLELAEIRIFGTAGIFGEFCFCHASYIHAKKKKCFRIRLANV
jgi:hypothetical protein